MTTQTQQTQEVAYTPGTEHTPLPWSIDVLTDTKQTLDMILVGPSGYIKEQACCLHAFDGSPEPDRDEIMANARLIVAATKAMGELAEHLNVNAVELAERLADGGLVKIVEALKQIAVPAHSLDEDDADGWCQLASDRREAARAALSLLSPVKPETE